MALICICRRLGHGREALPVEVDERLLLPRGWAARVIGGDGGGVCRDDLPGAVREGTVRSSRNCSDYRGARHLREFRARCVFATVLNKELR